MEFIRAKLGQLELAVELKLIQSVLDAEQAQSLRLLDPRQALGQADAPIRHVGLLRGPAGLPCGLCLGLVSGVTRLDPSQVHPMPAWLRHHLPPIIYPACARAPQGALIWLLNPRPLWEDEPAHTTLTR